ncbi:MAG: twin-arginine translocase TatA/TatE family subunit [Candidatus Binatia bacterium]|jgi:sec-independent protein translocase protein TatA|nr:twin-arginine translocase TatA/TatE family subunit [Candidatus Binatia bacterium]MDG1957333.1 twin-arginine translocase TatA/TatE family subunit [Candidatus Binatia bacterium]MDG2011427.1 twin-arginine translocase TatA/TatE family subunit [Candidatus Binatia bacterium]HAC80140.1 twin-arginine translocase TatA/TatE family subunit [Deltaproteobacteria bacterium]
MGLGVTELLIILAVVLLIFGPSRLPGLGSGVGDAMRNFRKSMQKPDSIDITPEADDRDDPDDPGDGTKV